jgi:hypothetical protein
MLSVANKPFMLSVVMLNVMAPVKLNDIILQISNVSLNFTEIREGQNTYLPFNGLVKPEYR